MMQQQPSYITQLNPNDVIVGRGAPANYNEGNKRFRQLAEDRKMDYVAAAKREVKDQIARDIVETVLHRQGRFVRKIESLIEAEEMGVPTGVSAWELVDYETALQKSKQALRDRNKQHGQEASASPSELVRTQNPAIGSSQSMAQGVPLGLLQQLMLNQQQLQQQQQQQQRAASISDYIRSNLSGASGASDAFADGRLSAEQILSSLQGQSLATSAAALLPQTQLSSPVTLGAANTIPGTLPISASGGRLLNDPLSAILARSSTLPAATRLTGIAAQAGLALSPAAFPLLSQTVPNASELGNAAERNDRLQAKLPAREQGSFPTPPSQSMKGETAGDIALRSAFERANGLLPKNSVGEELELSLLEMNILAALCSHGLPAWRSSKLADKSFNLADDPKSYSWKSFDLLLQQVAKDWYQQNSSLASSSLSSLKKAFISSAYKSAVEAAKNYEQDPKELAKKTIMLLERLVVFAPNKPSRKRDANSQGIDSKQARRLDSWLEELLCHWGLLLEVTVDGGRPFAYSAQDFMKEYPHHRQSGPVMPMGCLDSGTCRVVLSQIACVTRLRYIREKSGSTLAMKTKVDNATGGAPETNDLLLLERLVSFGFLGLFDDQAGSGQAGSGLSQVPSISQLGLSKASVQERVSQLVQNLHEQQIAEDRQAILQEARKRMVPTDVESPESSKHPKPDDSIL